MCQPHRPRRTGKLCSKAIRLADSNTHLEHTTSTPHAELMFSLVRQSEVTECTRQSFLAAMFRYSMNALS